MRRKLAWAIIIAAYSGAVGALLFSLIAAMGWMTVVPVLAIAAFAWAIIEVHS